MRNEYRVLTPESVEFAFELAGLASRMLAVLVDSLIIVALVVAGLVVAQLSQLLPLIGATGLSGLIAPVLVFASVFGYFSVLEWRWNGQTVGKRLLSLRVIDERGFSIDLFQSVLRNLLRIVDLMPFFYGVGGLTALLNPRQKRLGDFAAGTLVVRVRQRVRPTAVLAPSDQYNTLQEDAALRMRIRARLSLEERDLLLQLCLRRNELELEPRKRLFEEAAGFLERRLEQPRESFLSAEKYVQNIAAIALAESPYRGSAGERALPLAGAAELGERR